MFFLYIYPLYTFFTKFLFIATVEIKRFDTQHVVALIQKQT